GGVLTFRLTVQNEAGATATDLVNITVEQRLLILQEATSQLSVRLSSNHPGVPHAWDFGDGQAGIGETTSHTYGKPGTYTVKVTAAGHVAQDLVVLLPEPTRPAAIPAAPAATHAQTANADLGPLLLFLPVALLLGLILFAVMRRKRSS
ncbi:MAG: PKD domain-containing protein, partial [Halobacteriales archaeon]|nr:PKD domain-containing protein [Halobacteriales archaeon]